MARRPEPALQKVQMCAPLDPLSKALKPGHFVLQGVKNILGQSYSFLSEQDFN